jgi:ATP-binding cassette subfamily C (CFTR/MRP) protein 1
MTEIGENGINLSGGQKARLSLARACYADAAIYLLDDPLSAVDSRVGNHIFNECINGFLRDKTRILVTHQLHILEQVDMIIVMDNCEILAQGTYDDLFKSSTYFATLLSDYNKIEEVKGVAGNETRESMSVLKIKVAAGPQEEEDLHIPSQISKNLISEEERAVGAVSFEVFKEYSFAAGGLLAVFLLFSFISFSNLARVLTDQWLLYWSTDKYSLNWQEYVGYFLLLSISQIIFAVFYGLSTSFFGAKASTHLHDLALEKLYASPISFFDSNPLGRITSRYILFFT